MYTIPYSFHNCYNCIRLISERKGACLIGQIGGNIVGGSDAACIMMLNTGP